MDNLIKEQVLTRDHNACVICKKSCHSFFHLLDQRLFKSNPHDIDNLVILCHEHQHQVLSGNLLLSDLRKVADIKNIVLPEHFYTDTIYDHFGNILLKNGTKLKGELFFEPDVQEVLENTNQLHEFTQYVKYPRTYHLPFSQSKTDDDKTLKDCSQFEGKRVIVTIKMDGENTSMYNDHIHARSLDTSSHESRNWVKSLHGQIAHDIPDSWRICGENVYAKHSIEYKDLESYFFVFSIWNDQNVCLSWDDTKEFTELLGLKTVEVIYDGIFNLEKIKNIYNPVNSNGDEIEGFVVRLAEAFLYKNFQKSVAKFVRKNHVHSESHWLFQKVVPNKLKKEE